MAATPWAVLLCKFSDDSSEPRPRSFYEDLFTASGRGQSNLVDFFDDASHGSIDLGGSKVFGWFTLSQARADYTGSGINPAGRWQLIGWATTAATSAGVNPASFSGVVVCMNVSTDLFGGGGAVCCDPGSMQVSILAQEIGHGFGLDHSRLQGSALDYQDRWDVMSTWNSCFMAAHQKWTLVGPGLNAANMDGRGWLDASRTWAAPVPPRRKGARYAWRVDLRPLHRRDLPGYLAVRVANRLFEFRVKERWDAEIPRAAVLVHEFAYNHSYLISGKSGAHDVTAGDAVEWDPGPPWRPIRIKVVSIDAAGKTARLGAGEFKRRRPPRAAPRRVSRGAQIDGGGWVIVDGRPVHVPPRSPLAEVLRHVAMHELSRGTSDPRARELGERQALRAIHAHLGQLVAHHDQPTSPAPLAVKSRRKPKPKKRKPKGSKRIRR